MDPQAVFCHNLGCPARGQSGQGNIGVPSRKDGRYIGHVCGQTFTASKGTAVYRLRTPKDIIVIATARQSDQMPFIVSRQSILPIHRIPSFWLGQAAGASAAKEERRV